MTRQEAIKLLKSYLDEEVHTRRCVDAHEMAIKALEQDSVLDKIKGYIDHIRNTGMGKKKSLEFIEKFIEGLKTKSEDKCIICANNGMIDDECVYCTNHNLFKAENEEI
jgi:hypothetical protein